MNKNSLLLLFGLLLLMLLPLDRVFGLHVIFLCLLFLLNRDAITWWKLVLVLLLSMIHDVSYFYQIGMSGMIVTCWLLLLSLRKKVLWWQLAGSIFMLAQLFAFLDSSEFQIETVVVRGLLSFGVIYFWEKSQKKSIHSYTE